MQDSDVAEERLAFVITRGNESPPLTVGPRRLHYAFSVELPAIHLTFVSIVQGIALTVLLQSLPLPTARNGAQTLTFIVEHFAYLPYLISGALVLIIWKQFVQASMFYIWPLSTWQIALMLIISSAEVVTFNEIGHFYGWLTGLGVVAVVGGITRLNNIPLRKDRDYEFKGGETKDYWIEGRNGVLYVILGLLIGGTGIVFHYQLAVIEASPAIIEWVSLIILTGVMAIVVVLDDLDVKRLIDNAIGGDANNAKGSRVILRSDLERTPQAGLRYKPELASTDDATSTGVNVPGDGRPDSQATLP